VSRNQNLALAPVDWERGNSALARFRGSRRGQALIMSSTLLNRIYAGRTDLVFDLIAAGLPANTKDGGGVSLVQWCGYYGDISAIRFLIGNGASLSDLGANLDLSGAAFHGHWRLCEYLIESGADPGLGAVDTGETPLHSALCAVNSIAHTQVVRVLLAAGADPNIPTLHGKETGAFMRDCRTKGETPLHRAAAFGTEEAVELLLEAGGNRELKDASGETPLSWASWHQRPASILRKLCYGPYRIRPGYSGMDANLIGKPVSQPERKVAG